MKQLSCEVCGGTDIIKQDGLFVCQSCGLKYSAEEIRKMMIEGIVEVKGTVKVDNSAAIQNYLTMARSAYEAENKSEAEMYCNKIIESDIDNFEAWFLKGKAAGWQSTMKNVRIEESVNCFTKAIEHAPAEHLEEIKQDVAEELSSLSIAFMSLCCNHFAKYPSDENAMEILNALKMIRLFSLILLQKCEVKPAEFNEKLATLMNNAVCNAWQNVITQDYNHLDHPSKYTWQVFKERCFACISVMEAAVDLSDKDNTADIQRYKTLIHITNAVVHSCSYTYSSAASGYMSEWELTGEAKQKNIDNMMRYHQKIKAIDPSYEIPDRPSGNAGGCYVATCVYGSYDCPEVWTLRRYRDYTLTETWYGRAFIKTYYAVSPMLVKWFGHTVWFKRMWKGKLDHMVADLQKNGVQSTPYQDKNW